MGLLSGGSSRSSTSVQNNAQNTAFSEIGGPAVLGEGNTVNVLDGAAIARAFGFAGNTLDFVSDANEEALDLVRLNAQDAYKFSEAINSSAARSTAAAIESVSETARSETENFVQTAARAGTFFLLLWGGISLVKAFRS